MAFEGHVVLDWPDGVMVDSSSPTRLCTTRIGHPNGWPIPDPHRNDNDRVIAQKSNPTRNARPIRSRSPS